MSTKPSIEQSVKQQFARLFVKSDWHLFKRIADYYLRQAAFLKTADVDVSKDLKLLVRNSQKRLFIGIGTELLLKAVYLKHGFQINVLKAKQANAPTFPFTFVQANGFTSLDDKTYMIDDLINKLYTIPPFRGNIGISRGLKIAKVFRNKEGHSVLQKHKFDASNYRSIESSLVSLYERAFNEHLQIRFSIARHEKGVWKACSNNALQRTAASGVRRIQTLGRKRIT